MNVLTNSSIGKDFDNVFFEIENAQTLNLKNNNCLRLFYLNILNNEFTYTGLHQLLQRNIGRYVFSRATIEQFKAEGDIEAIGLKAIELLRQANNPNDNGAGGELGEILLYMFLENKLNAPKLLSKVELKTSYNQYVFGSDGVHLLQIDNKTFQLVFGESKMKGELSNAIDEAFKSIEKVSIDSSNELRLIEKNILSESFDEETTEYIKSIVVPLKKNSALNVDNAFGIFLGYTLDIDAGMYSNTQFRDAVIQKLKDDVKNIASYIEKKINASGLMGYSFYFYILPFNNAKEDRANILNKLKGE